MAGRPGGRSDTPWVRLTFDLLLQRTHKISQCRVRHHTYPQPLRAVQNKAAMSALPNILNALTCYKGLNVCVPPHPTLQIQMLKS